MPIKQYDYPEAELEDSLRRAFVIHKADYVIFYDRRQKFLAESAALGEDKGWLVGEFIELDEQSSEIRFRLTESGKKHFGVTR